MDFGTVRSRPLTSTRQARITVRARLIASLHLHYDYMYGYEIQLTAGAVACMVATLQL
jgi:hypothetical protein